MGTSGGTSVTAMVACCLHHVTDVLPILGLSAAATFLTRYQRPFMLIGLGMNHHWHHCHAYYPPS